MEEQNPINRYELDVKPSASFEAIFVGMDGRTSRMDECTDNTDLDSTKSSEQIVERERTTTDLDSTKSSEPIEGRKRTATEKNHIYPYMKRKVLNYLEKNGCSAKSVDKFFAGSTLNRESMLDYLNQRMQLAQMHVHEECNSLSFKNIEKWLEQFKKWGMPERCLYEPALVVNAIVNNEDFPNPDELNGVDLKSVYNFLGNALLGLPQPELNEKSAKFLTKELETLVEAANTNYGDKQTLRINQQLTNTKVLPGFLQLSETASYDPLSLECRDNEEGEM